MHLRPVGLGFHLPFDVHSGVILPFIERVGFLELTGEKKKSYSGSPMNCLRSNYCIDL